MIHSRKHHLLLLCIWFFSEPSSSQLQYSSSAFRPGEVLTYKVKWSVFRLGTITIRQTAPDPGYPEYVEVTLDGVSAAGLPFIDVYFKSISLLHAEAPTSILYELYADRQADERLAYIYDPSNLRAFALAMKGGDVERLDTLEAPVPYYDGTGLFMFARAAAGSDTTVVLPTIMDYAMGTTSIRFSTSPDKVSVSAFENPVSAYSFEGFAQWTGSSFAGMSGEFRGWVSTDERRFILRAEVKIFLGSAVIELESIEQ